MLFLFSTIDLSSELCYNYYNKHHKSEVYHEKDTDR